MRVLPDFSLTALTAQSRRFRAHWRWTATGFVYGSRNASPSGGWRKIILRFMKARCVALWAMHSCSPDNGPAGARRSLIDNDVSGRGMPVPPEFGAEEASRFYIESDFSFQERRVRTLKHGHTFAVFDRHGDIAVGPGSSDGL